MRRFRYVMLAAMVIVALPVSHPVLAKEKLTGEQELAKILKDRVAGKPVSCIWMREANSTQIIEKTAIVYDSGSVIYVNRPKFPQSLHDDDILVTKTWNGQLCNMDTVQLMDRTGGFYNGFVGLEDFVPYRRVAKVK
jgi:hypothetical protein